MAWIELADKRTGLSLALTERPDVQLPGGVLILDRVMRPGIRYTYHRTRTPEALLALQELRSGPRFEAIVEQKEAEHVAMMACGKSTALRRAYLYSAPDGLDYDMLARIVQSR
jgi:hypothetical protein